MNAPRRPSPHGRGLVSASLPGALIFRKRSLNWVEFSSICFLVSGGGGAGGGTGLLEKEDIFLTFSRSVNVVYIKRDFYYLLRVNNLSQDQLFSKIATK